LAANPPTTAKVGDVTVTTVRSLNGRNSPVESIEEKVISDSGGVRVIERIVKRFDPNGNPGPPEKQEIEEKKNGDGSVNRSMKVMRADLNGHYQLAERRVTEARKSGDTTSTTTTIERGTLNGGLELTEKRDETVRQDSTGNESKSATLYRKDVNGRFGEAAKEVLERKVVGNKIVENAAAYETSSTGQMQLLRQTVSHITKSGANERREIDVFEPELAGQATGADVAGKPKLREQRVIEKTVTGDRAVENVYVSRTSPNNPNELGPARKVAETVCTGKCN
jgi:hypothetical protein